MKNTSITLFTGSILLSSLLFTGCGGGESVSTDVQKTNSTQPHQVSNRTASGVVEDGDQWHKYVSISSTYDRSDEIDHKLSFEIVFEQGVSENAKHFQFYIDTDYNAATGWSYGEADSATVGADYMIEDGVLFKSTSTTEWKWEYVDTFDYETIEEANNQFRIKLFGNSSKIMSITDIDNVQNMNISVEPVDAQWQDTHNFVSNRIIKIDIIGEGVVDPVEPIEPDVPNDPKPDETVYEDAENGISADWITVLGQYSPERRTPGYKDQSAAFVKLRTDWIPLGNDLWHNESEYHLPMNNSEQKILSVDIVGDGQIMQHYTLGAKVTTEEGVRTIAWDSFYNHEDIAPTREVYDNGNIFLTFPSPVELVRGYEFSDPYLEENFKVDFEAALKHFEPDNTILSIDTFVATGGNLDNIKLLSK